MIGLPPFSRSLECHVSRNQTMVKICGLREVRSAAVAVEAGADALGFILAPSRRQITPAAIRAIREELSATFDILPAMIGVVVNASAAEIAALVQESTVDMIQLSGDEEPDALRDIDVPVIRALRFPSGMPVDSVRREIDGWVSADVPAKHVIVEGHAEGSYGGTGTLGNWALAAEMAEEYPIWLAGGLDPTNVGSAIGQVRPAGVDVSSGIETDGMKDAAKIRAFVAAAQSLVS